MTNRDDYLISETEVMRQAAEARAEYLGQLFRNLGTRISGLFRRERRSSDRGYKGRTGDATA